jgi:hypothetical protein
MQEQQVAEGAAPSSTPTQNVIDQHVQLKETEIRLKSRFLAGAVLAVLVGLLAHSNNFDVFGPNSYWHAAGASFLVGWWLGERAVFAILGGVVTFFFMRGKQGEL